MTSLPYLVTQEPAEDPEPTPRANARYMGRGGMTFPELFQLPTVVDLNTAARAVGVSLNTAYRLVHHGKFPCAVMRLGFRYRVPTAALMKALGIDNIPVHIEDVDHGAAFTHRVEHAT